MPDTKALIKEHIVFSGQSSPTWDVKIGQDPTEARIRDHGVHVWALIEHMRLTGAGAELLAKRYRLPVSAVQAALAYYDQHKSEIDARIILNAA